MSGYNWGAGKSNNAVTAEADGLVTCSKITRAWLADAGISEPVAFVKWLAARGFLEAAEWHHTSKFFNRVNYYSAKQIADDLASWDEYGHLDVLRDIWSAPETRDLNDFKARHELTLRMREIKKEHE